MVFNARINGAFIHMPRLRVVAAAVCIIFVSSLVLIPFANADWTMFHADTSHSGAGTGNPALNPTLTWKYATGDWVESSPAVANNVVYIGSDDNNVYALNATNGNQLWNYTTNYAVFSSPAVANGAVYVGSYDGNVYALDGSPTPTPTPTSTPTPTPTPTRTATPIVFVSSATNWLITNWLIVSVVIIIVLTLIIIVRYRRRRKP